MFSLLSQMLWSRSRFDLTSLDGLPRMVLLGIFCVLLLGTSARCSCTLTVLDRIDFGCKPTLATLRSFRAPFLRKRMGLQGGTLAADVESEEMLDKNNNISICNQSNIQNEKKCFEGSSSEMLPSQKTTFTIWQALFQPELLSKASAERENLESSGGCCSRCPPPEAMDIFLLPLAFLPGGDCFT
jgi:hypothetical protein